MAKISGRMPGGDRNGLAHIESQLVEKPHLQHVLIAIVDTKSISTDVDTGDAVPTVRLLRVEVVSRGDLAEAERLVRRALERRSGGTVLPIELEDEIALAFKGIDPETGEILPGGPADEQTKAEGDKGDSDSGEA